MVLFVKEDIMNIAHYVFKSPYPSQIQVGRLETSVSGGQSKQENGSELVSTTNESLNNAESFKATQTQDVQPTVKSDTLLDTYA